MEKRIAVVTGATRGIGKAIVLLLIRRGYHVIMVDVDEAQGEELERTLGKDVQFIHCDISVEKDVIGLFEKSIQQYKQIDALINNAGIVRDNMIWKMAVDDFDQVVNDGWQLLYRVADGVVWRGDPSLRSGHGFA